MGVKGHLGDVWGNDIYPAPCGRVGVKYFLDLYLSDFLLNTFTWSVVVGKL